MTILKSEWPGYLDKVVSERGNGNFKELKGYSFRQFVKHVLSEARKEQDLKFLEMNYHWRPISAIGFFCTTNYTVISKMKTYDEDKKRFLKMVGIKEEIKEERHNVHGGESIQDKTKKMLNEIEDKDLQELIELFKYDFELFDYSPSVINKNIE